MNEGGAGPFARLRRLLTGSGRADEPELLAAVDEAARAVDDAWGASIRVCEAKALALAERREALSWRGAAEVPDYHERLVRLDIALESVRECASKIGAAKDAWRTT